MSEYTDYLEWQAETLSPEEDGYEEKLLEIASYFRSFGEALTAFLVAHGFDGEADRANLASAVPRGRDFCPQPDEGVV